MSGGKFEKVDGSDFELEADLVLLAMGFVGPEKPGLLTDLGVEFTDRGNVVAGRRLPDVRAGRVRRRRHGPRTVADRLGDRRGSRRGSCGRPLPDGRHRAARTDQADGGSATVDDRYSRGSGAPPV